jgi:type I restriction enzyme S subunit
MATTDDDSAPVEHSQLPSGWCWVSLGELASPEQNAITDGPFGSNLKTAHYTNSGPRVIRLQNIGDGIFRDEEAHISEGHFENLRKHQVNAGDLVIAALGESLPRACVIPAWLGPAIVKADCIRFKPDERVVSSLYLNYALNNEDARRRASAIIHGVGRPRLNLTEIKSIQVPLAPPPEQARLVAKVDELLSDLDAGVSALVRAKANLKRYRAAILKAAVTGELTTDWRATHPNVEPATKLLDRILVDYQNKLATERASPRSRQSNSSVPASVNSTELPGNWCLATVDQLGAVQLGRQRSPKNRSDKHPTKYVRAANITEGGLALEDLLDMEFTPTERETYRLRVGDIILSEASGSLDQVGKPAVWNDEVPNCCFQNTVIRLRPVKVSSRYLLVVFRHFYFNKVFARVAAGVGINHLSARKFAVLPVPLPPLLEQEIIISEVEQRLSVIEATENYIEASLKRAARLRQSILKEAFAGRLVRQDPNDEPASVLLDRIRQVGISTTFSNGKAKPRTRKPRQREFFE